MKYEDWLYLLPACIASIVWYKNPDLFTSLYMTLFSHPCNNYSGYKVYLLLEERDYWANHLGHQPDSFMDVWKHNKGEIVRITYAYGWFPANWLATKENPVMVSQVFELAEKLMIADGAINATPRHFNEAWYQVTLGYMCHVRFWIS